VDGTELRQANERHVLYERFRQAKTQVEKIEIIREMKDPELARRLADLRAVERERIDCERRSNMPNTLAGIIPARELMKRRRG
jgi:hypothetical protein